MAVELAERAVLGGTFHIVQSPGRVWADIWLSDFGDQLRVPQRFQRSVALGRPTQAAVRWSQARHREACERWVKGLDPIREQVE